MPPIRLYPSHPPWSREWTINTPFRRVYPSVATIAPLYQPAQLAFRQDIEERQSLVTYWTVAEPAAPYLLTVSIRESEHTNRASVSGQIWLPSFQ
jgi:hypothetical protein